MRTYFCTQKLKKFITVRSQHERNLKKDWEFLLYLFSNSESKQIDHEQSYSLKLRRYLLSFGFFQNRR